MKPATTDTCLIYDGDCPACRHYASFVRLRDAAGTLRLINAREAPDWVQYLRQREMPLDEGMVLIYQGRYYHGVAALQQIARLSNGVGLRNRLSARLFRSPRIARSLYPLMRTLRHALLRLLGRKRIDPDRHPLP
ncbi:MAG: thiol-disulfide oxidoreductase DCC family protein [Alcanivorax nanhaiticus]